ncbi:group II intron reverse transcriptase/maturase [Actinomycetospora lutea]|uniref:group II intron reverse transcriptase/maturase n=1 Tax=Actinomycetospora lutea TaxID=663604 RepID=UPI00236619BD|nr:group II intron reverse transcriptase/maturase [Actinomycetospora lutea]MDD7942502.1 group II intron reverse transcriptase/maturase [Actinomycetospora lutea]
MPKDAALNSDAPALAAHQGSWARVSGMQAKLHQWAAIDPGRRFDDLFNLVHDPATLKVAFDRVASNTGARTAGVDGRTATHIEQNIGAEVFLDEVRAQLKTGAFRALPVRERKIPKPGGSGKVRSLGIPTVADRVVQAALKLVLEPIFEADFMPVSYGFRPKRRAHDAIAEIHLFGTNGYRWVLDADIEACFDTIDHAALLERARVSDKRVLVLVKGFLKAGLLSELGEERDTPTGTPQGGILSPLLANIALSGLDEHLHRPWQPGGVMSTKYRRMVRRHRGSPVWRIVRYADDFVVLVHGTQTDTETVREEIARVLAPMGLALSPVKTAVVHMGEGFDFLGFRIQWRRKKGANTWHVYTFIADRPVRSVKAKIRALTNRNSQQDLGKVLRRLNQIMHGWATYFRHAVAKRTFAKIAVFAWRRVVAMMRKRHRWQRVDLRRRLIDPTGRWGRPAADGIELFDMGAVWVTRYRYRSKIPNPWVQSVNTHTAETVESPLRGDAHGGFGERPGETDREQSRHRAPGRLNRSALEPSEIDRVDADTGDETAAGDGGPGQDR